MTSKRIISLFFAIVFLLLSLCACGQGSADNSTDSGTVKATSLQNFANAKIGVVTGSVQAILLPQILPDADYQEYNTTTDASMALASGKIDAFTTEESVYLSILWEGHSFDRIDEAIAVSDFGMIFGKGQNPELQKEFNEFLAAYKQNGGLAKLERKWFAAKEPDEVMDYESLAGEKGTLKIAINSSQKPFAYVKNGKYAGFDIEILTLFAKEYGYNIEFEDASFGSILSGISLGTYDIGASGITVVEERRESVDYSDIYHTEDMVLVVKGSGTKNTKTLDDFNDATLGVIVGSLYDGYSKELFPNATIDSYQTFADLFQCVKQEKIDGFLLDIPNYNAVARTDPGLSYIPVPGYTVEIGYAFGKDETGVTLLSQMNELFAEIKENGTFDELFDKWCGDTEPAEPIDVPDLSGNPKKLTVAIDLSRKPFVYLLNGEYVGFEIEILYMFCEKYGYDIEFESAQWTSGVAGLRNENGEGKYDILSCGIYMSEERKESVNFCDPYLIADVIMVIYEENDGTDFLSSVKKSFERTFIEEDRWKLIAEGVMTTLIISVFSVLGGSLFGFLLYMLARSANKAVSGVTKAIVKVYSKIIAGTPMIVVLMILYYVIFGTSDISSTIVAIFGFILTFGSFVYSQLALTVEGVDRGQTEAAYALGYTRNKTFFRIVLPQALRTFLPTYTGEVVGLIKATAVVGYIAVNDLTKMGDIIRSNTYEAFFPLIAVAVIYFIITWGAASLLGIVGRKIDPKKRNKKNILKGVVR